MVAAFPRAKEAFDPVLTAWTTAADAAKAKGPAANAAFLKKNPRPQAPRGPGDPWTPTGLFNGMINPLLPYAVRGVLWYQGEGNAARAAEYHALFAKLCHFAICCWQPIFSKYLCAEPFIFNGITQVAYIRY